MGIPKQADIEGFLIEFKRCWDGKVIDRVNQKNEDTLVVLGITPQHRAEEVRKLKYADFFRGPSPDHLIPGHEWWEFGLRIKKQEIYIKIKVYNSDSGKKMGKCMSFHLAEEKITYPYKKKG